MAISLRNAAAFTLRKSRTFSSFPNRRNFLRAHHNYGLIFSPPSSSQFNPKGPRYTISAAYGTGGQKVLDTAAPPKIENNEEEPSSRNWKIKMLYDGECPLCMKEVNMLKERDKSYGAIKFVDISSEEYSPEQNQGLDYETVMGRIHAILSDGTVVKDVEVKLLYRIYVNACIYCLDLLHGGETLQRVCRVHKKRDKKHAMPFNPRHLENCMKQLDLDGYMQLPNMNPLLRLLMLSTVFGPNTVFRSQDARH